VNVQPRTDATPRERPSLVQTETAAEQSVSGLLRQGESDVKAFVSPGLGRARGSEWRRRYGLQSYLRPPCRNYL